MPHEIDLRCILNKLILNLCMDAFLWIGLLLCSKISQHKHILVELSMRISARTSLWVSTKITDILVEIFLHNGYIQQSAPIDIGAD